MGRSRRQRQRLFYSRARSELREEIQKRHRKGKVAKGSPGGLYLHGKFYYYHSLSVPSQAQREDFRLSEDDFKRNEEIEAFNARMREATVARPPRISAPGTPAWEESRVKTKPKYEDVVWKTRTGERALIERMDSGHLVNTLRGCMRRETLPLQLSYLWAFWMTSDHVLWKTHKNPTQRYHAYKNQILDLTHGFHHAHWGKMSREELDSPWEVITALMMECADRGLEHWFHDGRCDCQSCETLRARNKAYVEKHPQYKRM